MDACDKYIDQATEKFRFFRLNLPSTVFDVDLADLSDEIIEQLESRVKNFKTKKEKYRRLNPIMAKAIFLFYKKGAGPKILSTIEEDHVMVESSINEIPSLVSHKWRLIDSNQKVSISSCLSDLIGHALPPPSSSPEKNEIEEEQLFNDEDNYLEQEKEKPKANESPISSLLAAVKNRCIEIIKDQFNEFYVTLKINNHVECVPFKSDRFKNVIRNEYFEEKGQILSDDRLDGILKLIESQLMYHDDIKNVELNLRVAKTGNDEEGVFYYDLTNQKWEIIKITSEGWDIVKDNDAPIFKRHENNQSPQVHPSKEQGKEAHWDRFLKLFNLETKSDIVLLSIYLVSLFVPDILKGILVLSGNGGGAKTMTFKMIKNIVDPGSADTFSFPKQVNDLVQTLSHHHVNFSDNVSSISNEVSDILCRAVTGASFSKRALYTNDNDIIYKFERCIGVNGINLATTQPDFLDRALVIRLKRIPNDKRKKECDIDREFEELRPFVLGYILDVLVKALRYTKEHRNEKILKEYPRMADFAEWGEIISRCLGYEDNEFINAYYENIGKQNDEVIESSPVAESLILFAEEMDTDYWEGPPTHLYKALTDITDQIKPELKRSNLWPRASNKLTFRINEITPNLKEKGIEVITGEKDREGNRVIKIHKMPPKQKKEGDNNTIEENVPKKDRLFNIHIHRLGYSDTFECYRCP